MDSTTHALPATAKQIAYARSLALRNKTLPPCKTAGRSAPGSMRRPS